MGGEFIIINIDDYYESKSSAHIDSIPICCAEYIKCTFERNPVVCLFINSGNGAIVDVNEKACTFYGYTKSSLKTMFFSDLVESSNEKILDKMRSISEENNSYSDKAFIDLRNKLSNGKIKDVEVYCNKVTMLNEELFFCQIVDVSHLKKTELMPLPGEKGFRALVELSPNAIVVCDDYYIVFANDKANKLFKATNCNELISKFLLEFIHSKDIHNIVENINEILFKKSESIKKEYKIIDILGKKLDVEISAQYIYFNNKDCVQLIIRDITKEKKEVKRAIEIQERSLIKDFPLETKARMNCIWLPAMDVSGDFYEVHKVNDECVIGIIGDVCGKGATAALNVSAIRVLFHEAISMTDEPSEIMNFLNTKVSEHLNEDYVAVLCFNLNFKNNILKVVGAGINEFIHLKNDKSWRRAFVKGPFLGMFNDSHFGQSLSTFEKGDKILIYTDGMDFIFQDESTIFKGFEMESKEYAKFLRKKAYRRTTGSDDTTCLVIDIL